MATAFAGYGLVRFEPSDVTRRITLRLNRRTDQALNGCAPKLRGLGLGASSESDLIRYAIVCLAAAVDRASNASSLDVRLEPADIPRSR